MLNVFIAVGVLVNLFFDFYASGKLTNINLWSKRTKVLLIFLVNLVILSITNSQLIAITIELFSLYYLLKSKNIKFDYAVLGSILSTMTVSYVGSFIFDFFDLKLVTQYKSYVLLMLPGIHPGNQPLFAIRNNSLLHWLQTIKKNQPLSPA